MSKKMIALKIDVTKIDKARLFQGQKGTYLDAVVFLDDEADQYGNNGMITQSVSKEERESGVKGAILGNCKVIGAAAPAPAFATAPASTLDMDDPPF
jgi:hypothetical protein